MEQATFEKALLLALFIFRQPSRTANPRVLMTEPVSRSVYYTTLNLLTVLAQQGDPDAIAALQRSEDMEIELIDDGETSGEALLELPTGTFVVTEHGATFSEKVDADPTV